MPKRAMGLEKTRYYEKFQSAKAQVSLFIIREIDFTAGIGGLFARL